MPFAQILPRAPDPSMCVSSPDGGLMLFAWDMRLVVLSVAIAIAGSFAALECAERMKLADNAATHRRFFFLGAGLMGLAIWTMHFVGMLALQMPMAVTYSAGWSGVSILAAAVGAGLAFFIMNHGRPDWFHVGTGGIAMGVAIASMHYLGMKSMQMGAVIDYEPRLFALSILIAVGASAGALAIGYAIPRTERRMFWLKGGSAVVMGFAIAGMHYVGMAAARYRATSVGGGSDFEPMVGTFHLRDVLVVAALLFGVALVALAARSAVERERALAAHRQLAAELENRVRERTAELEAMNRELSAFSYSVSHDLRNPLRSIGGFSEVLLDSHAQQLDATGQHYLRRIIAGVRRMDDLLEGLLNLAHVSQATLRRENVDLTAIAAGLLAEFAEQEPGRKVETVVAPNLQAAGDRTLLTSVLQNLLGNAWKFTAGKNPARVEFGELRNGKETVFFVRDNGAGFNMAHVGKLFGVFERLHPTADFAGNGIGLAVAKRIVERHGGRIWGEAAVGEGATFHFTLG